jgi:Sec-independent protein translocase protein TatA
MNKSVILLLLGIIIFLFSDFALPQNDTSVSAKRKKFREAIRQKLIEDAGFSDENADKYIKIAVEYRKTNRELNELKNDLTEDIESDPDAADVEQKINKLIDTESKIAENRSFYWSSLKEFLSPLQIAKTISLSSKLKALLKQSQKPD